jgi:transposase
MADAGRWKPYVQRQGQLLPAFVDDALDPSDPVFFIDDVVEGLELTALEQRYAVLGEHAYDPRLLLKLWLYGATQGVYSGRELARRVRRDLAFRYLAGAGPAPDFRTMNRFRVRHREDFAVVLRETVRLAQGAGLVRLGLVAIDGTKLRANTSRSKALSHQRMVEREARLEAEIAAVLQRLDEVNAAEDAEHDEDDEGSGGLPAELQDRQQRLAKLKAVRTQLEQEKGEKLTPKHQKSLADPEANMMRVGNDGALTYAYNAQAATSVDGIIVAVGLTTTVPDTPQAVPMVAAVTAMTGAAPGCALMDKGYLSEANLVTLRAQGQRCLIAVGRESKAARWPRGVETQRMHRLLRLPWARRRYAKRKTQGERPFAEIKQAMQFRRCQLRGRAKVWGEWNLVAAACNLRRLCALGVAPA